MAEVYGNNLIIRDEATNAIIPVVQSYSENMENKAVSGNHLIIRDPETNAIIPVVKVDGGVKSFVCGGDDEFIWSAPVRFTEITMSDTIDTVAFKAGETTYNDIVGVELPAETMLEIVINLKAGYDKGVIQVSFLEIQ
ncbi:MAG: hypothetical protein LBN93_10620 [Candidatus Symbiothrix sp.]|jgi:hypothetical protein|nr:hypothetical protein [Candidatus Symbiothrix sp.]